MSPIPPVSINAAFRSSRHNEAYIFFDNEFVLVKYNQGAKPLEKILNGGRVIRISDGFQSLEGTPFGDHGIDCAFDTIQSKAYIFSGDQCAYIDYAPGTTNDRIIKSIWSIAEMFPCLKDTAFEKGIDAAFRSSKRGEAYLFKGDHYALLNYASNTVHIDTIVNGWKSLETTDFVHGVEAAFASHATNEAYVFKGAQYAVIHFNPDSLEDNYITCDTGEPKLISDDWPAIGGILARKNGIKKA